MATKTACGGCLVFLGIAGAAALVCGLVGSQIGLGFQSLLGVGNEIFPIQVGMLAGIAALGVTAMTYTRFIFGPAAKNYIGPATSFLSFMLIGMKCMRGHGLEWSLLFGFLHGLVGLAAWRIVIASAKEHPSTNPTPPLTSIWPRGSSSALG
jgi:hypothetical protein